MAQDDKPSSGIRNVAVGFASTPETQRRSVAPAPPYRILIAGDFALGREGERQALAGRDISDLLGELSPALEVTVENRLGSFPTSLAAQIRLDGLSALRPSSVIGQFAHHRDAARAVASGDFGALGASEAAYDKLAALLQPGAATADKNSVPRGSRPAAGDDDGLDALFDLIDTPTGSADKEESTAARRLRDFISETIVPKTARSVSAAAANPVPDAVASLLDEQAAALTADSRLCHVMENWHALRLLLEAAAKDRGIEITLLQLAVDADAATTEAALSGGNGALHRDDFDLVLLANRCAARGASAEKLNTLAKAAETFGIVAFATLTPDFADVPAERLAAMDAPHQILDGPGFETFRALRQKPAADRMALFWNDVLAVEGSKINPPLFVPAAFLAVGLVMASIHACGWPRLRVSSRPALSGFPVSTVIFQGRETAVATRVLATADSAGGLASAGIATLSGRPDRDSVQPAHLPLLSVTGSDALYGPKLGDQLVFARLMTLMQSVLPGALHGDEPAPRKAALVEQRLAELAQAITETPRFRVAATRDEDDAPVLDITVELPQGIASRDRFEFQIPL